MLKCPCLVSLTGVFLTVVPEGARRAVPRKGATVGTVVVLGAVVLVTKVAVRGTPESLLTGRRS